MKFRIVVQALWDEEARVWVATSADIAGLAIEADTLERLTEKVIPAIEDLIELNGIATDLKETRSAPSSTPVFGTRSPDARWQASAASCARAAGITRSGSVRPPLHRRSGVRSQHTANAILKQAGPPKRF